MRKFYDLLCEHVHNENARKSVLKYCEPVLSSEDFLDEGSFDAFLENFKKRHPEINFD